MPARTTTRRTIRRAEVIKVKVFKRGGMAFGCLMVIVAVILCSAVTSFAVDRLCYSNLSQRLPLYPNAEVKRRVHNLFTEFGMGNTVIVLVSSDDPDTVRDWYAAETGTYVRDALRNNTPFFRMAQGTVDVTHNPDGEGSQIILFGTCVN
jgi:hypothetical protein